MLRLIFTMMSTLALLALGAVWLAAQPSGGEVRAVAGPVLDRGLDLASSAARRVATALGSELRSTAELDARRVPLTPTASGVWEPDAEPEAGEAPPAPHEPGARKPEARPEAPPAQQAPERRPTPPEPEPVEEVMLAARAPFVDGPLPEDSRPAASAPAAAGVARSPDEVAGARSPTRPDHDEWAALIRRMLSVHDRVRGVE